MANIAAAAILKRIREVVDGGLGTVRTISATRFEGDLPAGLPDEEQARRALTKPRFEVSITSLEYHESTPAARIGSRAIMNVTFEIVTVYRLDNPALADDARDVVRAAAVVDADAIRQALEWANLSQTDAGAATGLVSGRMRYLGSEREDENFSDNVRLLRWRHLFSGIADITQATS